VAECPTLSGCYAHGKTVDEAFINIQEAIALALTGFAPIKQSELVWRIVAD